MDWGSELDCAAASAASESTPRTSFMFGGQMKQSVSDVEEEHGESYMG